MWPRTRNGGDCLGGSIVGYSLERIYEEVAFIAYHFSWSHEEIMNMEHRDRKVWCEEISKINRKLNNNAQSQ